jgi:hypothetical protein
MSSESDVQNMRMSMNKKPQRKKRKFILTTISTPNQDKRKGERDIYPIESTRSIYNMFVDPMILHKVVNANIHILHTRPEPNISISSRTKVWKEIGLAIFSNILS